MPACNKIGRVEKARFPPSILREGPIPELHVLGLFVGAALVLLLTPGPAVLFLVTLGLQRGRRAGLIAVLGLTAGSLVQVAAAVLGLSALLASSPAAFTALRFLGAGYLVYLGFQALRRRPARESQAVPEARRLRHFTDGFLVQIFNPKASLFHIAFLPQFVDPAAGPVPLQLAFLGLILSSLGLITDSLYVLASAWIGGRLARNQGLARWGRVASAAVYVGLGVTAALSGRGSFGAE